MNNVGSKAMKQWRKRKGKLTHLHSKEGLGNDVLNKKQRKLNQRKRLMSKSSLE